MTTNDKEKEIEESKLIKCKNCRQDILKEKMFLHEGFCVRNNQFCEHCEKVFLKKDYSYHIKSLKNIPKRSSLSKKESDSLFQSMKTKETLSGSIKHSPILEANDSNDDINYIKSDRISMNPHPSLTMVRMPLTELYKINTPIIISENGQIVSDKNKNEYLLPYFGINSISNNCKNQKLIENIIKEGEIFKENNNYQNKVIINGELKNIYNSNTSKTIATEPNLKTSFLSTEHFKSHISNISNISNINNISNASNISNDNISTNSMKFNESKSLINNNNNYNSYTYNHNSNRLKEENEMKSNKYILNNREITFNSKKIMYRNPMLFTQNHSPRKGTILMNSYSNNSILKSPMNSPSKKGQNKSTKILGILRISHNNGKLNSIPIKREPKDSNSKRNKNIVIEGISRQKRKLQNNFKNRSICGRGVINLERKKCEFCDGLFFVDELDNHIQNCKLNNIVNNTKNDIRKNDIPKPKRKNRSFKNEMIIKGLNDINDEVAIDDNKRSILKRQFNASTSFIQLNNENNSSRGLVTNPERVNNIDYIMKDPQKIALKKRLFHYDVKEEEKNDTNENNKIPRDSIRGKKIPNKITFKRKNNKSLDGNAVKNNSQYSISMRTKNSSLVSSLSNANISNSLCFLNDDMRKNFNIAQLRKKPKKEVFRNNSIVIYNNI